MKEKIILIPISLDKFITYDPEVVTPRLVLSVFGKPLSRSEHYRLAKKLYPCRYVDSETSHEWQLADANEEHGFNVSQGNMILTEKPPKQDYIYHWSYARNWQTDKLWAFDKEMLPEV